MLDGRTRVTVVGAHRKADLALPSAAPIAEYSADLAGLCGTRGNATSAVWSLTVAGTAPLPLTTSLAESGVVDGQVLYLRDIARDSGDDPVVADIDEMIASESDIQRNAAWPRPFVVLSLGLVWLVAAAVFALYRAGSDLIATAIGLIGAGLLLLAAAWAIQQQSLTPPLLRVLTSLAAVPAFAAAAALLGRALAGDGFGWPAAVAGATAGLIMSYAATPEPVVVLLTLPVVAATLMAPLLLVVDATAVQVAAATVVAMLSVVGLSKRFAAFVTVWSERQPADGAARNAAATMLLIRWRRLLTALLAIPAIALALALVILALSGNRFALAMAATGSIALLVRSQQSGFSSEFVPIGGAGLVGLFAVTVTVAERIWHSGVASTVTVLLVGLTLVASAMIKVAVRAQAVPTAELPPGFPSAAARPNARRRFIDVVGVLSVIATASLALGVFGVFDALVIMGREIIG